MKKTICFVVILVMALASAAFCQPAPIWETGQKASYYSGDDGDLERGVAWPSPRFADYGNGTVMDNLTGLMWTKNANLPNGYMNWQQALNYVAGMNAGTYPNYGYHDWRLPNRKELFSLIDHSRYNPALPADHPFTNVQASYYWSSTSGAYYPDVAWIVPMWDGYVIVEDKSYSHIYVWPVRSGQSGSFGNSVISFRDAENPAKIVVGAAADGASQAIIQIEGLPPGTTTGNISIILAQGDGTLVNNGRIVNGVYTRTYQAPEHYARDGHSEDITEGRRAVGIVVTVNGQTLYPQFFLVKPPVVLLHGLWSGPETWDELIPKLEEHGYDRHHNIIAQPYSKAASFAKNSEEVNTRVQEAFTAVRGEGYVAKKADVVGHSMGGVLAKLYGHASDIHSIITVGTPHYGSPCADILWWMVGETDNRDQQSWFERTVADILNKKGLCVTC